MPKYRQSSLIMSAVLPGLVGCGGIGPNVSHFLTPFHALAGCGAFHLRFPTGGAAYGMALYTASPPSSTPSTSPVSTCVLSSGCLASATITIASESEYSRNEE